MKFVLFIKRIYTLIEAFFRTLFLQAFDFSSRTTRTWLYVYAFLNSILTIVIMLLSRGTIMKIGAGLFEYIGIFDYIKLVFIALCVLSAISIIVRRLHDVDKSGWFIFVFLIPVIGPFFAFILLFPGTDGRNRFGSDPRLISRFK